MKNISKAWPDKQVKKVANKYIAEVVKSGIPVNSAYLFGSYAKGNSNKYSDIDICVVSSIFGKDRLKERVMLMNLQEDINDDIEPHPFSPEDFSNPFDPLASQIKKYGLLVM